MSAFAISAELQELLNNLKGSQFENNIAYMYVDSVGKITVGVGHNLTAQGDVLSLPFVVKRYERHSVLGGDKGVPIAKDSKLDRPATTAEIQNDYDFLKKHSGLKKYGPEQLQKYTTLELGADAIQELFVGDLKIAIDVCRKEFGAAFDKFPVKCQAGLIDIAFNAGSFRSFQTVFVPAIKGTGDYAKKKESERWTIASQNCKRGQVSATRNDLVAKWFLDAASSTPDPK